MYQQWLDWLKTLEGNSVSYGLDRAGKRENSPLKGKRILFLGSSVTFGAASQGISFAEFLAARNDCIAVKEAVSGTTLVDNDQSSYVSRLLKVDRGQVFDLVVCQLSTNDATKACPLGEMRGNGGVYDRKTVCGAIEFIISYVREVWNCPVVFYTNAYYDSTPYADMVRALKEIRTEYGIDVIDMYSDETFNRITAEERKLYMADPIHPTRAGYLKWWTPYIEDFFVVFYAPENKS